MPDTKIIAKNFHNWFRRLTRRNDFSEVAPDGVIPMIGSSPNAIAAMKTKLKWALSRLTEHNQKSYARVLVAAIGPVARRLLDDDRSRIEQNIVVLEALVGAATQPIDSNLQKELHGIQALASDIYTSFLDSRRELTSLPPLQQPLPPVVSFTSPFRENSKPPLPPFTLDIDDMQQLWRDFKTSLVAVPWGYKNHPLFWSVLAHEVGGHDVLHADTDLLDEIIQSLDSVLPQDPYQKALWKYWGEETTSEVCGILNLGPAYAIGAMVFYAYFYATNGRKRRDEDVLLNYTAGYVEKDTGHEKIDNHPCHILFPHIALGVIDSLCGLAKETKEKYHNMIEEIATLCTGSQSTLRTSGTLLSQDENHPSRRKITMPDKLPLDEMQRQAYTIGKHLATVPLRSLDFKNLQHLETWDDDDEKIAEAIQRELREKTTINSAAGDDAQIMAGSIMTVINDPTLYDTITDPLKKALEQSYTQDKRLRSEAMQKNTASSPGRRSSEASPPP